ncbi:MAG: hypothetical protein DLM58_21675 [Pseudonocardiales bacterium]|nr:MAG: hypothetical protein DLM58_21675 [Pseudonocardiales bacterium]
MANQKETTMTAAATPDPSQNFHVGGKGNRIKNVKQKIVITPQPGPTSPVTNYQTKWALTTPLTQGRLALLSIILGVLALIEGYQGFAPVVRTAARHGLGKAAPTPDITPLYVCMGALVGVAICVVLYRTVKHALRGLSRSPLLPAVLGVNRHLVIARFAGACACGGKLRFYSKPTGRIDIIRADGSTQRRVTERRLAAECKRNPDHWAEIDPAERRLDD